VVLISTKEGAGCLEKAKTLGIHSRVVTPAHILSGSKGLCKNTLLNLFDDVGGVDFVFLVGCIVKVPDLGMPIYNIHPADPHRHGGQGMYGIEVHCHVLLEIIDLIKRGMAKETDRFFTSPTVHEVVAAYDQGCELLRGQVEIPLGLIQALMHGGSSIEDAAKSLQQIVLPREWQMLPCAVRLAASKILAEG
jgi:folate-dependent phosphoribosylglycinamide formyltransferase PurN